MQSIYTFWSDCSIEMWTLNAIFSGRKCKKEQFNSMGQYVPFIWKWSVPLTNLHCQQQTICFFISLCLHCCTPQCNTFILCVIFSSSPLHRVRIQILSSHQISLEKSLSLSRVFFIECQKSFTDSQYYMPTIGAWRINSLISIGIFVLFITICSHHPSKVWTVKHTKRVNTPIQWDAAAFPYRVNNWNFIAFIFSSLKII